MWIRAGNYRALPSQQGPFKSTPALRVIQVLFQEQPRATKSSQEQQRIAVVVRFPHVQLGLGYHLKLDQPSQGTPSDATPAQISATELPRAYAVHVAPFDGPPGPRGTTQGPQLRQPPLQKPTRHWPAKASVSQPKDKRDTQKRRTKETHKRDTKR